MYQPTTNQTQNVNLAIQNYHHIELYIQQFDIQFEQYCQHKEDQLRDLVESTTHQILQLVNHWKQSQINNMSQNPRQQILLIVDRIKNKYEKIVNKSKSIIKCQSKTFNRIIIRYTDTIRYFKYLKQSRNQVWVDKYSNLNACRKQIIRYQKNNKQYQIFITFFHFPTIQNKIQMMQMINTLDADTKVVKVYIGLGSKHEWNHEIVTAMINRYTNVYSISLDDRNHLVDSKVHDMIQKWLKYQPIIEFKLWLYYGSLYTNHYGLNLIKHYNQIIKHKQYLAELLYEHDEIGGQRSAESRYSIQKLIDTVLKI